VGQRRARRPPRPTGVGPGRPTAPTTSPRTRRQRRRSATQRRNYSHFLSRIQTRGRQASRGRSDRMTAATARIAYDKGRWCSTCSPAEWARITSGPRCAPRPETTWAISLLERHPPHLPGAERTEPGHFFRQWVRGRRGPATGARPCPIQLRERTLTLTCPRASRPSSWIPGPALHPSGSETSWFLSAPHLGDDGRSTPRRLPWNWIGIPHFPKGGPRGRHTYDGFHR